MYLNLLTLFLAANFVPTAVAQTAAQDSSSAQSILAIDAAVREFTATLNQYTGGINSFAPVTAAILNIHAVNRQGYSTAQTSPTLNVEQSQYVVNVTQTTVGTSIPESINLTIAKKPLIDAILLTSLVETTLELLQYDHDTFSLAVGAKLDPSTTVAALAAAGAIAASIGKGTLVYAVPGLPNATTV